MDIEKFNLIKHKYGHVASWAIWKEQGNHPPMFNIGDLSVLDPQQNPNLLSQLKPDVVFVGLNTSIDINNLRPFSNFHSSSPHAKDYKIRFATIDTKLWGGYMTDIIKDYPELHGQNVVRFLGDNPDVEKKNIETFREELKDLGTENRTIIAFGGDVYRILKRNLQNAFTIVKVSHYSRYINKQKYRDEMRIIEEITYGKRNPEGTNTLSDGQKYVGEFKDGERHGHGTLTQTDGTKYVGGWKNGKRNGQGTLTLPNGFKYVGEWRDGLINGQGTSTYPNGSKYEGEFKDGEQHGQGTLTYPNGSKYEGEWKDGERNGQGTVTNSDGEKYVGGLNHAKLKRKQKYLNNESRMLTNKCVNSHLNNCTLTN